MFSLTRKFVATNMMRPNPIMSGLSTRLHSTKAPSVADVGDVFKVDYTEEFDQGLTADEKA
jgi:hypothetical protein